MIIRSITAMALAAGLAMSIAPAQAEPQLAQATGRELADNRAIQLCNRTGTRVQVAYAWPTGRNDAAGNPYVTSKGWFGIESGACLTIARAPLVARYYYFYAQNTQGREWRGTYPVCVSTKPFEITETQCGQGYNRRNFDQIDMAGRQGLFTMNLNP